MRRENFVMNLSAADDRGVTWRVWSAERTTAILTGHVRGELLYSQMQQLDAGENNIEVDTRRFPAGVAVFTLFNEAGREQAERLVFVNRYKQLRIKLTTDKKQYKPGETVNVTVQTTDAAGNAIPAQLSLAVVDDQLLSFADDKQDNIVSSLLLSSEVRCEIQEPSFYFDEQEAKAEKALDYLLMTQGWRRFTWDDVQRGDRPITHMPEKIRNIAGTVVNSKGVGISAEVTLMETGNRRRIERVRATPEGHFVFRNIDPTTPVLLATRRPGILVLQRSNATASAQRGRNGVVPVGLGAVQPQPGTTARDVLYYGNTSAEFMTMDADVAQLSEVVVTGYGLTTSRENAGCIMRIAPGYNGFDVALPMFSPLRALQGRVAGIVIQPASGNPGSATRSVIRGMNSLGRGNGEPLYVVDGIAMSESINSNFSLDSFVGPEEIESISVLHTPEATTVFGSRAANGVVMISTRRKLPASRPLRKRKSRYTGAIVAPRKFSPTREFYSGTATITEAKRDNFQSTVYWNPLVKTDRSGKANISFHTNDAVSAFRITAEGISNASLIGRGECVYASVLPVSLDVKLPTYVGFEDEVKVAVRIRNNDVKAIAGQLKLEVLAGITVQEPTMATVNVPPDSTLTVGYTLRSNGREEISRSP